MTAKNNGVIQPWILCDDRVRQSRQLNTGYNGYVAFDSGHHWKALKSRTSYRLWV